MAASQCVHTRTRTSCGALKRPGAHQSFMAACLTCRPGVSRSVVEACEVSSDGYGRVQYAKRPYVGHSTQRGNRLKGNGEQRPSPPLILLVTSAVDTVAPVNSALDPFIPLLSRRCGIDNVGGRLGFTAAAACAATSNKNQLERGRQGLDQTAEMRPKPIRTCQAWCAASHQWLDSCPACGQISTSSCPLSWRRLQQYTSTPFNTPIALHLLKDATRPWWGSRLERHAVPRS